MENPRHNSGGGIPAPGESVPMSVAPQEVARHELAVSARASLIRTSLNCGSHTRGAARRLRTKMEECCGLPASAEARISAISETPVHTGEFWSSFCCVSALNTPRRCDGRTNEPPFLRTDIFSSQHGKPVSFIPEIRRVVRKTSSPGWHGTGRVHSAMPEG